jgi:hypothetical protein
MWYSKAYPNTLKEDLGSGVGCDTFLASCQNDNLRESINNQKCILIYMLG